MPCKGVTHALLGRNGNIKLGGGNLEENKQIQSKLYNT